ncbi:14368_t:CDS:2 [Ambispora leptoticha]|uniref:14368_t:CDS:1 n=1 Tax=Ambispora leptoticha TaxID=144679 RepID=A0A9N8VNA4_9GLOM|nr:14368_t:CDS:2 [Ambispora leptoticha]
MTQQSETPSQSSNMESTVTTTPPNYRSSTSSSSSDIIISQDQKIALLHQDLLEVQKALILTQSNLLDASASILKNSASNAINSTTSAANTTGFGLSTYQAFVGAGTHGTRERANSTSAASAFLKSGLGNHETPVRSATNNPNSNLANRTNNDIMMNPAAAVFNPNLGDETAKYPF